MVKRRLYYQRREALLFNIGDFSNGKTIREKYNAPQPL